MPKSDQDKTKILSKNLFPVVGIGASAGGLDAFKKLLKAIPENSGIAYVLVQHLDPTHESMLPELLQKVTNIPVLEISDDIKVQPNHIYVIPSNKMMVATDGVLLLAPRPVKSKTERNLPIDLFFTSLAEVHQAHAIGVVLSGTASDGTLGLKAIKDHGGITFAQDEESAAYEGMPHSAAQAGVVDFILPPEKIPQKLLEVTKIINGNGNGYDEQHLPLQDEDVFKQILSLLRIRKGTDFTYYKQTTIRRRILRRMALNKNEEPADYLKYLRENKPEQDVLYQDLLIPVTSFFRDPKIFDNLCESVFPHIAKNKTAGEPIRVWVAGCSTGEEAYSIAICLKEFLGSNDSLPFGESRGGAVQIFATDISEPAIAKARTGIYTKNELAGLTPQRLQEFFTKNNGGYQANKSIRDICVFAVHNFLKDPPFGKMDFVSCRNVLIYMEPYLQKKALTTFHYSLNLKGFLLLGKSETVSGVPDLFASAGKNDKLFTRKDVPGRFIHVASQRSEQGFREKDAGMKGENIRTNFERTADDIILSKYTPAGVVVNEAMDIVHFRGNTAAYLQQAPGKPSLNLIKMAKDGLAFELRNILHKARKEKIPVIKEHIPVQAGGSQHIISIEAIPLPNMIEPHYLILFHDNKEVGSQKSEVGSKKTRASGKTKKDDTDLRIQQLEHELAQMREDMRSITEDQEAANEELQSANEELLSGSEELQSLNEELETGKEELQSTNEELTVVNQEMISLNEQVTLARDYAEAIIATVREPLLVLDKYLRVKTANSNFYKTFQVNEQETEGRLIYDLGNKQWNIAALKMLLEEILPEKTKFTDFEVTHSFLNIGERIMLLNAREIFGETGGEKLILLAIEDVTEKKQAEEKIKNSEKQLQNIFSNAPAAIAVLEGPALKYVLANADYQKMSNRSEAQLLGKPMLEAFPELTGTGAFEIFENIFKTGEAFSVAEYPTTLDKNNDGVLHQIYYKFTAEPIKDADGKFNSIMVLAIDVTEQIEARKKIEESEQQFRSLVMQSPIAMAVFKGKEYIVDVANQYYLQSVDKQADFIGKPLFESLPELRTQGIPEILDNVMQSGIAYYGTEWEAFMMRDNEIRQGFYNFVFQPVKADDGTVSGIIAVTNDVTEQVLARKKVEVQNTLFSDMLMTSPGFVATLSGPDHVYKLVNERYQSLFGKRQIQGKPMMVALPELEGQGFDTLLDKVYQTGEPYVGINIPITLARDEGLAPEEMYFNFSYQPMYDEYKNIYSILVFGYEVTAQVLSLKKVEESEHRYHEMIYSSPSMMAIFKGEDMIIETANDAILESWGKGKDIIGKSIFLVLPETVEQGFDKLLLSVYKTAKPFHAYESPVTLLRNGTKELVYYNFIYQAQRNVHGEIEGVAIIATEVTSQALLNKKIKASEEQFRLLVLQAPVAICVLRGENYIIEVINESMIEIWDRTMEQALNKPAFDVLPELKEQGFKELLDNVYHTGERFVADELPIILKRNGKLENVFVKFVYEPLREADGTVSGVMALAHEITEQVLARKKIEESEKQFRVLTNSMPQKIWTADAKGNKNYFNQTLLDYTGFSFEELRGQGWEKIIHPDDWGKNKKQWGESISTGKNYEAENRLLRKDGEYLWHLTRAVALKDEDGKIKMWVGSKTEIHDQKTKEQAKDEFIAIASHELKTPLTTAKAYIQLLRLSMEKTNDKDLMLAKKASESIDRLNDLIAELLDVSKIQNGKLPLHITTFNFNEMITASIEQVQHGAPMYNIIKSGEIDQPVTGDKQRLQQVVINLLTNAIKYSPKNYNVFVHVVKENGEVTVSVKDNGIGIRKENLAKIFERYYREEGRAIHFQGLGIGLSISYEIIQRHNGKIWAQSEPDNGSTFYFTVPI